MYYLEKIDTHKLFGNKENFYLPGCIDTFLNDNIYNTDRYLRWAIKNIAKHFKTTFVEECAKKDIHCGTLHGTSGIDIYDLILSNSSENIFYEIGLIEFLSLPNTIRRALTNHKLIVFDFSENGLEIHNKRIPKESIDYLYNHPNIKLSVGTLDHSSWIINMCMFMTSADALEIEMPPLSRSHKHKTLVMARKPRPHRLDLLHAIDQRGLLKLVDWSLNAEFVEQENLDRNHLDKNFKYDTVAWENEEYLSSHPFVEAHKHELPKHIFKPEGIYTSPSILHPDLSCKYNLYISMETFFNETLPTEKTYKSFTAGIPVAVFGSQKSADYLNSIGFHCVHLKGNTEEEQTDELCQLIESNHTVDFDAIEHNYNLILDKQFVTSLCVNTLYSMFTSD